jgi:hypothetical protein
MLCLRPPRPSRGKTGPRLFGIPFGDFGLFASLLLSLSLGFMTFFGVTFLSIFGILIVNAVTHRGIDLSHGYKYVAFPAGCIVVVLSLLTLGTVWVRRRVLGK